MGNMQNENELVEMTINDIQHKNPDVKPDSKTLNTPITNNPEQSKTLPQPETPPQNPTEPNIQEK